ncbi:hypothetical protein D3C78_1755140 [compost metagenome]
MQGIFDQALHAIHFAVQPIAKLLCIQLTVTGDTQTAQGRAQLMGQVAQQLLLQGNRTLQPF